MIDPKLKEMYEHYLEILENQIKDFGLDEDCNIIESEGGEDECKQH